METSSLGILFIIQAWSWEAIVGFLSANSEGPDLYKASQDNLMKSVPIAVTFGNR